MREGAFSYFSAPFQACEIADMVHAAMAAPCWDDGIEIVSVSQQGIQFRVRCDFETADRLLQFLREIESLPDPEGAQLATASHELLYNAIEYGGKLDPTNHAEIECTRSPDQVTYRITDHGPGFRFDQIPHAAIANPADEPTRHIDVRQQQGMRPGGYGILVARQLVDELVYGKDGREVLIVKYLGSPKSHRPNSESTSLRLPQMTESA
jgi:anti-sigma regulatory factor (Ser/Thr protein kinase)